MWQPSIQQFKELFTNEYIPNIMVIMNTTFDKSITPTELSDILEIHVTTAKKYLELLVKYNFATKKVLTKKLGRPSLYTLTTNKILISLSLDEDSTIDEINIEIWNPTIREIKNIDEIANYIQDKDGLIEEIKVKIKTKAKRYVTLGIKLSKKEQQFMKYLPFSTAEPKSLIKVCQKAGIETIVEMKSIETFVRKIKSYNLIEIIE